MLWVVAVSLTNTEYYRYLVYTRCSLKGKSRGSQNGF
jgi:hypothetical protein